MAARGQGLLAHHEHELLMVSYCGQSMSIVPLLINHCTDFNSPPPPPTGGYPGVSCPPPWAACPPPQKTWQTQFKMIFIFFYNKFITHNYQNSSNVCFSLFFSLSEAVGAKILQPKHFPPKLRSPCRHSSERYFITLNRLSH